jgi:hypothetical protein
MPKRDSKGRFVKRGHRRGMGSIISIRRGMGALPGGAMGEAIIPGLVGAGVTAAVALSVRSMVDPNMSPTNRSLVKWGWAVGHGAGILASLGLLMVGGTPAAVASFVAATGVGLALYGQDMLTTSNNGPRFLSALVESSAATAPPPSASAPPPADGTSAGTAGIGRRYRRRLGTGAIVPEYSRGMGAIVMEPTGPGGKRAGTIGSYGETVSLSGINTGAFGTPGFNA